MSATFTERLLWGRSEIHVLDRGQFDLVSEMGGSLECGFALTSGPLGKLGGLEKVQQRHLQCHYVIRGPHDQKPPGSWR